MYTVAPIYIEIKNLLGLSFLFLFLPLGFKEGFEVRHQGQDPVDEALHGVASPHLTQGSPRIAEKGQRENL